MNTKRDAFLADLHQLLNKHKIGAYYFYGIDADGGFGDYAISQEELTDMIFDVFQHDDFAQAAEEVARVIAQELVSSKDSATDLSGLDEMKWTWRKKV